MVTVLFADLASFTARAETLDPEDVAAFLDPYHARLKEELERFGGTVEKFIGDAVMAVFGAPVAHEDDAERAVRAALAIRDWAEEEGVELRIGVNTGEALVTLGSRPAEGQALAAGDVVNTAARLQAGAPTGAILAGAQTYRATERAIEYDVAEPVVAKGKAEPVAAWLARRARARAHVERAHGGALVGRQREVELLAGSLDRARRERSPELVTLVGVPGIGKSRLVLELYNRIEAEPELTAWRHGRCVPYGEGVTFWALGQMVKAQAGILDGDGEAEAARKLAAAVDDPWIEGHLRPLVGLPGGPEGGADRREEAFTAWRRFFEELADERPLVLVFDDLHWADDNLLDFVDHLTEWATGVPLLVVCTARPELLTRRPGWGGGKPNALTITLSPLSDDDTARLVAALLERSVLPAETQRELLARAGGNPLYAEEYTRMLRESGRVDDELPETVQGLIAARIDLLEPEQKALLQDAAVVGRSFWAGALADAADADVESALHALQRREFVRRERQSSVAGETEYTFHHVLVRDVAYGQIPRADRAAKHLAAAGWIERLGRAEDHAEMLAHHYLEALELAAASRLDTSSFAAAAERALTDAGDRALSLSALAAARRYYRAALDVGAGQRAPLLLRLGSIGLALGDDARELVTEARDAFAAAGDTEGAAEAEYELTQFFWLRGERDEAWACLARARDLVADLPPSRVKALTIATASRLYMLADAYGEAIPLAREAIAMAEELGLEDVRAGALNNLGTALAVRSEPGEYELGLGYLREAIEVAERAHAVFELTRAKGNLAVQLCLNGQLWRAIDLWREAEADAAHFGQLGFGRWFKGVLPEPLYVAGQWDEALELAQTFVEQVEAGAQHYLGTNAYLVRAEIRLARGDAEGAAADAGHALAEVAGLGDPQAVLPIHARAARISYELGDLAEAARLLEPFLEAFHGEERVGFAVMAAESAAIPAVATGKGEELFAALAGYETPWARAGRAFAGGDPVAAAAIVDETGATTHAAYLRLEAARAGVDTEAQARLALAFFRSVGATRYVRECESLVGRAAISG